MGQTDEARGTRRRSHVEVDGSDWKRREGHVMMCHDVSYCALLVLAELLQKNTLDGHHSRHVEAHGSDGKRRDGCATVCPIVQYDSSRNCCRRVPLMGTIGKTWCLEYQIILRHTAQRLCTL